MPAELIIILDDVDNKLFAFIAVAVPVMSLVAVYFVIHAEHKVNGDDGDGDNDDEHDVEKIDDVIPKIENAVVVNLRRVVDDIIVCIADMVLLLTLLLLLSLSVLGIDTLRRRDVMVVKIEDRC
jgi:hypothetical protein